jgi:hypothetical protein
MPKLEADKGQTWLGLDPGASGGLALLGWDGSVETFALANATDRQVWDWLILIKPSFAAIEKVGGYIGVGQPGSAMFQFGRSTGKLIGFLVAADIPFEEVPPQRWQRDLGITPRKKASKKGAGESKTEFKRRLRSRAEALFPKARITNDVADSLLIAEWCRRSRGSSEATCTNG